MNKYKKFEVGKIYILKYCVKNENGKEIPAGTQIRIVAITPKVYIMPVDKTHDNLPYFYNAVLSNQESDYSNRIRENFCTLF